MGVRHREHPTEGVQFHPESILTVAGHDLLGNFLAAGAAPTAAGPAVTRAIGVRSWSAAGSWSSSWSAVVVVVVGGAVVVGAVVVGAGSAWPTLMVTV